MLYFFFCGALLSFTFAPFNLWFLAYCSLITVCYKLLTSVSTNTINKPKYYAKLGFCFGLGFFGFSIYWVFTSIHVYGHTNIFLASFLTLLFIIVLTLFMVVQFMFMAFAQSSPLLLIITFATSWVVFEWLRSFIFTGFPWCYLGVSHIDTILSGYAPIIGTHGMSYIILLGAGSLAIALTYKKFILLIIMAIVYVGGCFLQKKEWVNINPHAYKVAMIQGNISPDHKFILSDPETELWQAYGKPTLAITDSDLVIWPENSMPILQEHLSNFIASIERHIAKHKMTWFFGGIAQENSNYHVALFMRGKQKQHYYKMQLVPFGEFVPFERILRNTIDFFNLPMSNFKAVKYEQTAFKANDLTLLPVICYEIAFPWLVQTGLLRTKAGVILNVSEDGWFGNSIGPHQHLQIARMRALENGRYLIRSTTSGISAIINHKGKIITKSPQFIPFTLKGVFFTASGITPWTKFGNKIVLLVITCIFGITIAYRILIPCGD